MNLNQIQQALKVPKNHLNKFGGYNYRNCEDILEAVKPLLGDSVLTLTDEVVCVGNRNYVKATARFSDSKLIVHHEVTAYACESAEKKGMDSAQITGAASSYARKYALNGLFLIDDTRDADSDEGEKPQATPKPAPKKEDDQLLAAKDRTVNLLSMLGYNDPPKTAASRKTYYKDAVFNLVSLDLNDNTIEQVNEELAALVEKRDANK